MASGATYLTGRNLLRRARRGLYAGRMVLSGNKISEDGGNRSRRKWKPNVHSKALYSEILDRHIPFRLTAHALRCIDKAGGLDSYILNTPDKKMGSDVGAALREELRAAQLVPPPLGTAMIGQVAAGGERRTYGTWKGHVGPGIVFLVWGSWWTVWALWTYLSAGPPRRFRSAAWYGPVVAGGWRLPLEPFIKFFGPALIAWIELYGDHDEFRTLTCPNGRFAMTHMNNWQHASVYPGFMLAAALDWAAMLVPLPPGLQQPEAGLFNLPASDFRSGIEIALIMWHMMAALAGAFWIEGFLMANHKKHTPLDQSVHSLLVLSIYGTVAALAAEMWLPHSLLPALGRGAAALLQGAWLIQIARIMWGGDPRWSLDYEGSAMMPPVYFVWYLVAIAACTCTCYVLMALALQRLGAVQYSLLPQTMQDLLNEQQPGSGKDWAAAAAALPEDDGSAQEAELCVKADAAAGGGSFVSLRSQGSKHMRSDSANESRRGSPRLESGRVCAFYLNSQRAPLDW